MSSRSRDTDPIVPLIVTVAAGAGILLLLAGMVFVAALRESARVHAEYQGSDTRTERVLT